MVWEQRWGFCLVVHMGVYTARGFNAGCLKGSTAKAFIPSYIKIHDGSIGEFELGDSVRYIADFPSRFEKHREDISNLCPLRRATSIIDPGCIVVVSSSDDLHLQFPAQQTLS